MNEYIYSLESSDYDEHTNHGFYWTAQEAADKLPPPKSKYRHKYDVIRYKVGDPDDVLWLRVDPADGIIWHPTENQLFPSEDEIVIYEEINMRL